ncbi:MAG: hypothetical protein ACXWHB_09135 [Usitatibacter sp.]
MKIVPIVATGCLLALAGCAGVQTSLTSQSTAAVAESGAYYCWRDKLYDDGSNLVCNWERSLSDVCGAKATVSLAKSSVSGAPRTSHRCENGQWLVTVTSR